MKKTDCEKVVFLLEDEPAVRDMLERAFRSCGWRVVAATSPPDAVRKLEAWEQQIDVLLLDAHLWRGTWHDFQGCVRAALRSRRGSRRTRIIAISSDLGENAEIQEAFSRYGNAVSIHCKPFISLPELLALANEQFLAAEEECKRQEATEEPYWKQFLAEIIRPRHQSAEGTSPEEC